MNEQLIDKIKALIALSECPGTTEHERKLALKRAQELMLKYSISIAQESEPLVIDLLYELKSKRPFGLDNAQLLKILTIIGQKFGTYAFIKLTERERKLFLMGFQVNCEIAAYTADVLLRQGLSDCKEEF